MALEPKFKCVGDLFADEKNTMNLFRRNIKRIRKCAYRIASFTKILITKIFNQNFVVGSGSEISSSARICINGNAKISIGKNVFISPAVMIRADGDADIRIGDNVFIGQNTVIAAIDFIHIGDDCLIAENVTIRDQDHGTEIDRPFRVQPTRGSGIVIGNNVWLAAQVVVLKRVNIESSCVVGAGSVVTKDLPTNCIAFGTPAKCVKTLS